MLLSKVSTHYLNFSYNLSCDVTFSKTLQEPGMFLIGTNGDMFIKVNLAENLTQDTLAGKLVLSSVRTALLARAGSASNRVCIFTNDYKSISGNMKYMR